MLSAYLGSNPSTHIFVRRRIEVRSIARNFKARASQRDSSFKTDYNAPVAQPG
ncbi:MAG: hypothetical protein KC506_00400 [Nanoarchaeota archaeon]|nr:hypothetical protein [Nanoarchaeota archaeon]